MSGMLIDSIMGTIDHIYCDNTFHVITEQNHRRNTIVGRAGFYSQSKASKVCKKVGPKMQRGDDEWERRFVLIVSPAIIFAVMPPPPPPCRRRHPKLCKTFHGRPLPAAVTSSHWVRYAESSLILYKTFIYSSIYLFIVKHGENMEKKSMVTWLKTDFWKLSKR